MQKLADVPRSHLVRHFLLQVALVAIATGGYQSMLLAALVGYLGLVMYLCPETRLLSRRWWELHCWIAAVTVGGALLSEAAGHLLRSLLDIPMMYVDSFVQPRLLLDEPLLVLGNTLRAMVGVYAGSVATYGYTILPIPATIVLGLAALLARPTTTGRNFPYVLFQALAILIIPFLLNLLAGGAMPLRSLLAVPLAISLMAALAIFSDLRAIRFTGAVVVAILAIQSLYIFSALQSGKQMQFQHDVIVTSEIYRRAAEKIPDFDIARSYELDVYGGLPNSRLYPVPAGSTLGASILGWDSGNPGRTAALARVLGYPNFKVVSNEKRRENILAMMGMPTWPDPDAVAFNDGVVMVKFSDNPSKAHKALVNQSKSLLEAEPFWKMDFRTPQLRTIHVDITSVEASSLALSAGNDPQVIFSTGKVELMERCLVLELGARIRAANKDTAQLFFRRPNGERFTSRDSVSASVRGGGENSRVIFVASSNSGFGDFLRLDPTTQQASEISDVSLKCLIER